jgi:hypothetical protein
MQRIHTSTDVSPIEEKKRKEKQGKMGVANPIIREILNVDFLIILQQAIEEADRNNDLLLAYELRWRKFGVDTFDIQLVDREREE